MFDKKKLQITPAPFAEAMELKRAIGEAINQKRISLGDLNLESGNILETELSSDTIGAFLQPILSMVNSREVERLLMVCAARALYDKQKIDADFFESVERRELYFPIMFEIAKVNIGPFLQGLFSGFTGAKDKVKSFLRSK